MLLMLISIVSVLQQIISKNQSKFEHDSAYHINMYIFDKAFLYLIVQLQRSLVCFHFFSHLMLYLIYKI